MRPVEGSRLLPAGLWALPLGGLEDSPQLMVTAVARRLPDGAAFSNRTALWLHGLDPMLSEPIEVTIPEPTGSSRRAGASVRRASLTVEEIVPRRGLPTTSGLRTVVDLGGRNSLTEGVVARGPGPSCRADHDGRTAQLCRRAFESQRHRSASASCRPG